MAKTKQLDLYCRIGDMGDYEQVDDLAQLAERLAEMQSGPIDHFRELGVETDNYAGNNYVSLYWGEDVETPVRSLNASEQRELRRELRKALAEHRSS